MAKYKKSCKHYIHVEGEVECLAQWTAGPFYCEGCPYYEKGNGQNDQLKDPGINAIIE